MEDETQGIPEEGDSPDVQEQPEVSSATPEVDWQQRYTDTQASYTRSQQDLAQLREWQQSLQEDPETQEQVLRQLAESLGYQLDDEDQDQDPLSEIQARQQALEAQWQESQEQAQQEALLNEMDRFVDTELGSLASAEGRQDGFTDKEQKIILSHAVAAFPPDEQTGMPQVKAAFEEVKDLLGDAQQRWVKSKQAPLAPQPGTAGSEKLDLSDDDVRQAATARIIERAQQSS